jgi:DNA mismatch repair protein MutL
MPQSKPHNIAPIARDTEFYDYPSTPGIESVVEYIDEDGVEAEEQEFDFIQSAGLSAERREFGEVMYVGNGYAVAIYGGSVVLVSLRRAKERLLYEDIIRSLGAGAVPVQRMFFAEELILSLEEYELLENYATEFAALGFEIEYRGEGAISVSGRPAVIDMTTPIDELLYELLHSLDMGETLGDRERRRMAELMAQRGSHNYGGGLNSASAAELLRRLSECDNTNFTPSGCPIMAELTLDEIKAKLTR